MSDDALFEPSLDEIRRRIDLANKDGRNALLAELLYFYLSRRPNDTYRRFLYGDTLRAIGRLDEAEEVLLGMKGVPTRRAHQVQMSLGRLYEALAKPTEAERHYRRAAELAPHSTVPWVLLGSFLSGRGQLKEAITVLGNGLQAEGDRDEVLLNLGNCRRALRDYAAARQDYKAALAITPGYELARRALSDVEDALRFLAAAAGAGAPTE
jgi:tetratricopeptide (TPR) repeat protein